MAAVSYNQLDKACQADARRIRRDTGVLARSSSSASVRPRASYRLVRTHRCRWLKACRRASRPTTTTLGCWSSTGVSRVDSLERRPKPLAQLEPFMRRSMALDDDELELERTSSLDQSSFGTTAQHRRDLLKEIVSFTRICRQPPRNLPTPPPAPAPAVRERTNEVRNMLRTLYMYNSAASEAEAGDPPPPSVILSSADGQEYVISGPESAAF